MFVAPPGIRIRRNKKSLKGKLLHQDSFAFLISPFPTLDSAGSSQRQPETDDEKCVGGLRRLGGGWAGVGGPESKHNGDNDRWL